MRTIFDLIDILGILLEIYIVILFYNLVFENKTNRRIQKNIFLFFYFIVLLLAIKIPYLNNNILLIAFISTFLLSFLYNNKMVINLLYSLVIFSLLITSEMFVGLILTMMLSVDVSVIQSDAIYYLCGVMFSKFILFVILKILSAIKSTRDNLLKIKKVIPLLLLTASTAYIIYIISVTAYYYENNTITIMTIIGIMMLLLANIFIIHFIDSITQSEHTKQRLEFAENQLLIQTEHYNQVINNQIKIAKIYHDMNNSFISILGYFETKEYNIAKNKIKSLHNNFSESNHVITSSNACIDAILNDKNDKACQQNIRIDFRLNIPPMINIDVIDLCIIIGNALDNAIEACLKIENISERYILFQINDKDEYISIYIENSIDLRKNKILLKNDKLLHGYGKINIQALCTKYKGNAIFEKTKSCFKTFIIIKNDTI